MTDLDMSSSSTQPAQPKRRKSYMEHPSIIAPSTLTSQLHALMQVEQEDTKSGPKRTETRRAHQVIHCSLRILHLELQRT